MIFDSWNIRCDKQNFLSFWTVFCPFTPLRTLKIKLCKNEKNTWRYYHFTYVYHKWQSYDVWFLIYGAEPTEFFVISTIFYPFTPPNNLENQNFEKLKKAPGDIIILHICTINDNHFTHVHHKWQSHDIDGSWDMDHDRWNILSFWNIFCPFTPLKTWKIKILKKWKKHRKISFFPSVPKLMIISYTIPEIWCVADVIVIFHFGLYFAPLPPNRPKKQN